jgi:hypothetical protein
MRNNRSTTRLLVEAMAALAFFVLVFGLNIQRPSPSPRREVELEGREDDPSNRAQFEWMRLHDPATGKIPDRIRQRELAFAKSLPVRPEGLYKTGDAAGAQSTVWSRRGPINVGGRTRALAVDKTNPSMILAGGVSGGLWRSLDGGATWSSVTALDQLHSVSCIAQDTRPGHTATWYCGTGEFLGNTAGERGSAAYQGDGIFKSTDNGATWSLLTSTSYQTPQSFTSFFDYVWSIAIDPSNTSYDIVYAATYGAIWVSTNGGGNWYYTRGAVNPYSPITDVQVTSNGVVYASMSSGSSQWGVWRSVNGVNWADITPSDMLSNVNRIVLGIAPSNENVVYILAQTPGEGFQTTYAGNAEAHSFWKYTYLSGDGTGSGGSTENRSGNLPGLGGEVGDFASQGSYDLVIKVKPDNENVVYIGGTNLYRSNDGFASKITSAGWIGGYSTANDISQYTNQHADQHALAFPPNSTSTLYSGHDGGVSKTSNDLSTSVSWASLDQGYFTTQFYSVAIDHATNGSALLVGGMQDNGTWGTTSFSSSVPWVNAYSGDGGVAAIADGGSSMCVSSQHGSIYRMFLSNSNFTRLDPAGGTGYLFIAPYVLDPSNTNVMYLAAGVNLWRNSDITAVPLGSNNTTSVNWTNLTGASPGSTISAIGASKASPSDRVYYGTLDGMVYRLDNASAANSSTSPVDVWTGKGLPASAFVSCIAVDPTNGDNALLIFSNYSIISVFYTSDAGGTWTAVAGNLEASPDGTGDGPSVHCGAILPYGGNTYFYVGTSTGLYSTTSLNGMSTIWVQEGASVIGNVVVESLDTRVSDGLVVVGTHGVGVFSGTASPNSVATDQKPVATALQQNYPNPFNPSTTIRFSLAKSDRVVLKVFDINGREVETLVDGERAPGEYQAEWVPKGVASGTYVYRLQAGSYTETKKLLYIR